MPLRHWQQPRDTRKKTLTYRIGCMDDAMKAFGAGRKPTWKKL